MTNPTTPGTYLATWRDDRRKSDPDEHKWHGQLPSVWTGKEWETPDELNRHWTCIEWKQNPN